MIDCLVNECGLDYNSAIGIQELFECTQQTIMEDFVDCDEECMASLNQIRDEFYTTELRELFSQELTNEAANKIRLNIKHKCIE